MHKKTYLEVCALCVCICIYIYLKIVSTYSQRFKAQNRDVHVESVKFWLMFLSLYS